MYDGVFVVVFNAVGGGGWGGGIEESCKLQVCF